MASQSENKMPWVRLGKSGLKVNQIIIGGMSFGTPEWQGWVLDESESLPILEHAWKRGMRTWDTADIYSHGRSEEIMGKAIRQYGIPREDLVILSKVFFGVAEDGTFPATSVASVNDGRFANRAGLSRKHILDAVDKSVQRLGTYIDVLQIHRLDREAPKEEIMRALNDVVASGKVRYLGASSMYAWEFQQLQNIAAAHGWHKFISMQGYYNLLYREEEREMIPYCHDTGVGLIPWSPVARGALARPYHSRESKRETTDPGMKRVVRGIEGRADEAIIGRVEEIAKKKGLSMAGVATAWSISKGAIPIVGISKTDRIDEALENVNIKLTEDEIKYLEEPYQSKAPTF